MEAGAGMTAIDRYGLTPLHQATLGGHLDTVKMLVQLGTDRNHINAVCRQGRTALNIAACAGYADVVRALLAAEPDAEATYPLHCAALNGHVEVRASRGFFSRCVLIRGQFVKDSVVVSQG